jgi:hypothetical protein
VTHGLLLLLLLVSVPYLHPVFELCLRLVGKRTAGVPA